MKIDIVWGKSEGKTLMSAFDKALLKAGINNFNLIFLSSVIPPNTTINKIGKYRPGKNVIGDIKYVAISSFSGNKPNTYISAGLGWIQTEKGGLFIESKGQFSKEECEKEIRDGLSEMMAVRNWRSEIQTKIITHKIEIIANVTVAAVYDLI